MENCIKIWRECVPELKECMSANVDQRRPAGSFRDDNPEIDIRFLVHDSQVGAIIGKGGVNVKNLRMQHQLSIIKVFPVPAPNSSDRLVQIVGKFDKVFECFRVIYDTIESQTIKGKVENYNSENFDESLTAQYGGYNSQHGGGGGGGPGSNAAGDNRRTGAPLLGANDRNLRFNSRPPPNEQFFPKPEINRNINNNFPAKPPANRFDNTYNDNFIEEPPEDFEMKSDNFPPNFNSSSRLPVFNEPNLPGIRKRNFIDTELDNSRRGRMRMGNPNSSYEARNERPGGALDNRNKPNFFDNRNEGMNRNPVVTASLLPSNSLPPIEKVEVSLPKSLIHAIKGPNGEILSKIINESGAEISIGEEDFNDEQNSESILHLTGTKDQIEGAQYLMQIRVKKSVLNL